MEIEGYIIIHFMQDWVFLSELIGSFFIIWL